MSLQTNIMNFEKQFISLLSAESETRVFSVSPMTSQRCDKKEANKEGPLKYNSFSGEVLIMTVSGCENEYT